MKLIKRFSALRKGLVTAALASALFALGSCQNITSVPAPTMVATASKTLYAPSFPENLGKNGETPTYGERYYTVSQGHKRKIALSWNPVEIAKYYQVFAAKNINDTFVKIGETKNPNFEDSVGSGATFYYKVRAVNTRGETSDFSAIVHGTSLATPAINNIKLDDSDASRASIFWYMGNAGIDSYVKDLVYEIHAFKGSEEKVATVKAWDSTNKTITESYTFESLSGNSDYEFRVDAYIASEQSEVESSPKVSKTTLAQYTPVSPEFTSTQGESIDYVKLLITLPPKIQVQTKKSNETEKYDVDYPVCFEIQRKKSTESESEYQTIVSSLYCNETTTPPTTKTDYDNLYVEGRVIEYEDRVDTSSVTRGIKYDYRIISCIDKAFSATSTPRYDFDSYIPSKASLANVSTGWAAALPTFKVKGIDKEIEGSTVKKVSILGFLADWQDLDKAKEYKFAVQQNRRKFDYDNGNVTDTTGTDSWIMDKLGNFLTPNLEGIQTMSKDYDLSTNPQEIRGTYRYTLYVIPAKFTNVTEGAQDGNYLAKIQAINVISINDNATDPVLDLHAEGGWTDHTRLSWVVEPNVSYSIEWKKIDINGAEKGSGTITSADLMNGTGSYSGEYDHYVDGGYEYQYNLFGNGFVGDTVTARTLGTPAIKFEHHSYDSIKVTWPQVMAAKEYKVALGANGGFGNGLTFMLEEDGAIRNPDLEKYESIPATNTVKSITLTIKKPYGWNDAELSGKATPLVITAYSEKDEQNHVKGTAPGSKDVWTIGPAAANLKATETHELATDSVKISWTPLGGAVGYAVYRLRPTMTSSVDTDGTQLTIDEATDSYYVTASGTCSDPNVDCELNNGSITLTDKYARVTGAGANKNQQYLALGIPFTYTIIPVLENSVTESEGKITWTYANLNKVQKDGYTTGFGIALEATKAEYGDKVILNWELPAQIKQNNAKKTKPSIYWRKKGTNDSWTKARTLKTFDEHEGVAVDSLDKIPYTQALEYTVTYGDNMTMTSTDDSINDAYVDYLSDKYNLQDFASNPSNKEIKSVGYMFTMPQIEVCQEYKKIKDLPESQRAAKAQQLEASNGYSEDITWHLYDFEGDRAIGGSDITEYVLEVQNLDCSDEWHPVCSYKADGSVKEKKNKSWYHTEFSTDKTGMQIAASLTAKFDSDGLYNTSDFHNGLLKVMRDYKHYYRISAKRNTKRGEEITAQSQDYGFRKITTKERDRCVGLICADAFFQMGMPKYSWIDSSDTTRKLPGEVGEIKITHVSPADKAKWGTDSGAYKHKFPRTPGNKNENDVKNDYLTSGFVITIANTEGGELGGVLNNAHNLRKLPETKIAITHECELPSYTGERTTTAGRPSDFPYDFGNKHESADSTFNTSFQIYNGLWWDDKKGQN